MTRWLLSTLFALGAVAIAPRRARRPPRRRSPQRPQTKPAAPTAKPAAPHAEARRASTESPRRRQRRHAACRHAKPSAAKHGPGVYAHITTNHGAMVARLFDKDAPKTVENFVGLAEGKKAVAESPHQHDGAPAVLQQPDVPPHHPGFMIQGGDPEGTGTGGPDSRSTTSSARNCGTARPASCRWPIAGPNTNGGQFFITLVADAASRQQAQRVRRSRRRHGHVSAIGKVPTRAKRTTCRSSRSSSSRSGSNACRDVTTRRSRSSSAQASPD